MNETTSATGVDAYEQFVWRRLEEPFKVFGNELPWQMWLVVLGVVLTVALFYVVWMYIRDSASIGPWWASLLGLLRTSVYVILTVVFLLPARQSYVTTSTGSKVITVFDISGSMATSDHLSTGDPKESLPSRQEKVFNFLQDKKVNFFDSLLTQMDPNGKLVEKNPMTVYRFGTRLDENYLHIANGTVFTKEMKEKPERDENGLIKLPPQGMLPEEYWRYWLNPHLRVPDLADLSEQNTKHLQNLVKENAQAIKDGMMRGTNIGDSLNGIVTKELNNRVQGIIVFTDGRNTEGSPSAFRELESRARAARIPIFVVAVGEDRQKVKLEITDVRAPQQIQPEDKFRVRASLTGEGLAGEKLDVTLEIKHVKTTKKVTITKDPKTGKETRNEVESEEELPIELIEAENQENPKSTREKIVLGNKILMKAPLDVILDKGVPARTEVEWTLDAAALALASEKKIDLTTLDYKTRKWEIGETKEDSEFRYIVRVPVDKREGLKQKFHESTKVGMKVIKKPIRVLLVAASGNRDFQFVRSLLVRETDKKRLELAICFQLPPDEKTARTGVVMDIPPERLIRSFPDSFRKKKGDLYDLSSYDVIVAFDPDWKQITAEQIKLLKDWSDKGGGLVVIGGHINTVELIRPRDENPDYYKPLLDMLPVVLDDRRDFIDRKADDPWPLDFEGANPEMEFLKLDEELDNSKFKEDWEAFFYGTGKDKTTKPQRGFFSYYPVKSAKTSSIVAARFTDPMAKLKDNQLQPYIVMSPESLPRVVWIGSAETWRLREYREAYHERFWTKMVQYAAAKSKGGVIRPIRIEASSIIAAGQYMEVEAKIDGPDGQPLDKKLKPEITLKMPAGVPDTEIKQPILMSARPGAQDGWFSGRFMVRTPGDYEFTVKIPKAVAADSETAETAKFTVKEANPELDNTRPDYDRMYRLASEADDVIYRIRNEGDKAELKRRLQRPKIAADASGTSDADKVEIREDKMRLYFDLTNASLIPSCMVQDIQTQTSRGKYRDLWDDGVTIYTYDEPTDGKPAKKPIKIAYVLLAVVGLLSVEWLIRKLLRLA